MKSASIFFKAAMLLTAISLLLVSGGASAENKFFVQVDIGDSQLSINPNTLQSGNAAIRENEGFQSLQVGIRTADRWQFALGYQEDNIFTEFLDFFSGDIFFYDLSFSASSLQISRPMPLSSKVSLTPTLGIMFWEMEVYQFPDYQTLEGNDPFMGLSLDVQWSERWSNALSYRYLKSDDVRMKGLSLQVAYHF